MIKAQLIGEQNFRHQLQLLAMPPAQRRKVLQQLGKLARDTAKKRITNQTNIDGTSFAKRKRTKAARQKMLRGLKKGLVINTTSDSVAITYKNNLTGRIARDQQEGRDETMTAAKMARRDKGGTNAGKMATRIQARALVSEGFVVRGPGSFSETSGKKVYVPGIRTAAKVGWITANISMKQAGAILRSLRGRGASSWVLPGTPRSFLGANPGDINTMLDSIFSTIKTA